MDSHFRKINMVLEKKMTKNLFVYELMRNFV